MSAPSPADRYDTVTAVEADIENRLDSFPGATDWITDPLTTIIVDRWTGALSGFQANAVIPATDAVCLEQLGDLFARVKSDFETRAAQLGVGTMTTLTPAHVLFMSIVRQLQREATGSANFNPHKFRVLLDDRYTIA